MPTFWEERAANDLKAQIKRAGLTYAQMAMLLTEAGEATTEDLFNKKINRGTFRHFFYLQCVELIDSHMHKIRAERPESQWVSSGKSEA